MKIFSVHENLINKIAYKISWNIEEADEHITHHRGISETN